MVAAVVQYRASLDAMDLAGQIADAGNAITMRGKLLIDYPADKDHRIAVRTAAMDALRACDELERLS